jgi:hypothetical protein
LRGRGGIASICWHSLRVASVYLDFTATLFDQPCSMSHSHCSCPHCLLCLFGLLV